MRAQAFSDVDSDAAMSRVEDFVKTALYRLTRTSASWREGLPPAVYRKITGTVVLPLARGFVERIVAAPVRRLHRLSLFVRVWVRHLTIRRTDARMRCLLQKLSASAGAQLHHLALLVLEVQRHTAPD